MNNLEFIKNCEKKLENKFKAVDEISYYNQKKVLNAFRENCVALRHFNGTTGYGYDDEGRDCLGKIYAQVFGTESGIVSPHLLSGTHALTVALFGLLRPNDTLFCISGMPYDTLRGVIFGKGNGSLSDYGIKFECVGFKGCIFVDNCYGEFVEIEEPTEEGADLIVGSLIKNAGGGLAPNGGYICGKEKFVELIGKRLTAPSIGLEVGSYAGGYQYLYQGLFMAPHTVAQAVKTSLLIGQAMAELGYKNYPSMDKTPYDITRAIEFDDAEKMVNFIREVQYASPIDSFVTCEPWDMPGYDDKIIMAAGTFVSGASIELSADGPLKPPYIAYFQGGLTYEHGKYALERILSKLRS